MWFTQPERFLGLVLLVYVLRFGVAAARKLVEKCLTPKTYEQVMARLLHLHDWEERLMLSNYVGFLGEETAKDLLKYYYRTPRSMLHECNQLCLQMLAIVVEPDLFVKFYMENLLPEHQTEHMLQLLTEESFAVNAASESLNGSAPEIENVKKLYLINAMNVQRRQTFESIEKLFENTVLGKNVKLEQVLPTVADFDRDTGIYTVKPEYEGFLDRLSFIRNAGVYSKLHEHTRGVSVADYRKDTLLRYQVQHNVRSVCQLVTENLCESVVFVANFLCRYFRELWSESPEGTASSQQDTFRKLKIIEVCLVRCSNSERLKEFLMGQYDQKKQPATEAQQVLVELTDRFFMAQKKDIVQEKETTAPTKSDKAALRKKQLLEEMKNKSSKFIEKNVELMSPEKSAQPTEEKFEPECLICHEKKQDTELVATFRRIEQQTLPHETYQSFASCYHTFHVECLAEVEGDVCPLCRTPFSLIVHNLAKNYIFFSLVGP